MDNLQQPAYPAKKMDDDGNLWDCPGFSKLEKGALIIAMGLVSKYTLNKPEDQQLIAELSVQLATEVLKEANK